MKYIQEEKIVIVPKNRLTILILTLNKRSAMTKNHIRLYGNVGELQLLVFPFYAFTDVIGALRVH